MANSYSEILNILPKSEKIWVGTVESVSPGTGTSIVNLVESGGRIKVSGVDTPVGTNCLIVNGRITQTLPNLVASNVIIT